MHSEPDAREFWDVLTGCTVAQTPAEMEENHRPLILNLKFKNILKELLPSMEVVFGTG